jgi:HD-like signal output (HDOD) protein
MENPSPFTNGIEPLPVDTLAAMLLLDMFRDPDHDIDSIVEFISNDPVLTTETLKRCNHAYFCGSERTTDIFEAVSRLGFYELYDIIAASISSPAPKPQMTDELETFQNLPPGRPT